MRCILALAGFLCSHPEQTPVEKCLLNQVKKKKTPLVATNSITPHKQTEM